MIIDGESGKARRKFYSDPLKIIREDFKKEEESQASIDGILESTALRRFEYWNLDAKGGPSNIEKLIK